MSERQMTSIADQIRSAVNQRDALIIVGEAIDDVLGRLQPQPPIDPWAVEWPADGMAGRPDSCEEAVERQAKPDRNAEIESLREQLAATHDPEDFRALEARLRLARDAAGERAYDGVGAALPPSVPDGLRTGITSDGATGEVDIPPPTEERFNERYEWAMKHKLHEFLPQFTDVPAAMAFATGGARWLYYGNRDAVLAMPADWRQWLVQDIGVESEAEAQEVSRDIFKSVEGVARPA